MSYNFPPRWLVLCWSCYFYSSLLYKREHARMYKRTHRKNYPRHQRLRIYKISLEHTAQ